MKAKLLSLYGDTLVNIGTWFMQRGERFATWVEVINITELEAKLGRDSEGNKL